MGFKLGEYDFTIEHHQGKLNDNGDAVLHSPAGATDAAKSAADVASLNTKSHTKLLQSATADYRQSKAHGR